MKRYLKLILLYFSHTFIQRNRTNYLMIVSNCNQSINSKCLLSINNFNCDHLPIYRKISLDCDWSSIITNTTVCNTSIFFFFQHDYLYTMSLRIWTQKQSESFTYYNKRLFSPHPGCSHLPHQGADEHTQQHKHHLHIHMVCLRSLSCCRISSSTGCGGSRRWSVGKDTNRSACEHV